jgi:hypothetical protein
MTSRRRNSNKNLGNSISDVRRRLKYLERKPIRTKLQKRVINAAAIAPSSITAEEVDFGTTVITTDPPADVIENPKDGLLVVDPDTGAGQLYSEQQGNYIEITDDAARVAAQAAADAAATAQSNATTALADAATALTAANNSLQPSANTIVNASNQMTAINSTGITVYSGASATSGARIVLNSTGFAGFNSGGDATFSISATTGAAVFSGSVTGSTITGGTLNIAGNAIINSSGLLTATGATITGTINATAGYFGTVSNGFSISSTGLVGVGSGTITGGTITGAVIRQAASGTRIEMDAASPGKISFYTSADTYPGIVEIGNFGGARTVTISPPNSTNSPSSITLYEESPGLSVARITSQYLYFTASQVGFFSTGSFGMSYNNNVNTAAPIFRNIGIGAALPDAVGYGYRGTVFFLT